MLCKVKLGKRKPPSPFPFISNTGGMEREGSSCTISIKIRISCLKESGEEQFLCCIPSTWTKLNPGIQFFMLEVIIQGWQPQLFSAAIFKQADFKYLVSKVGIRECLPFQTLKSLILPLAFSCQKAAARIKKKYLSSFSSATKVVAVLFYHFYLSAV